MLCVQNGCDDQINAGDTVFINLLHVDIDPKYVKSATVWI